MSKMAKQCKYGFVERSEHSHSHGQKYTPKNTHSQTNKYIRRSNRPNINNQRYRQSKYRMAIVKEPHTHKLPGK